MTDPILTPRSLADPIPVLIAGLRRWPGSVRSPRRQTSRSRRWWIPTGQDWPRSAIEFGVSRDLRFTDLDRAEALGGAQIAVLATPPTLHKEQSIAALRRLHVISEKPVVMTVDEALGLEQTVKGLEHRLMVGEQYRFATGPSTWLGR